MSAAAYENVRLQERVNTEFVRESKRGFVKVVVSRAVRLRECPLRELQLQNSYTYFVSLGHVQVLQWALLLDLRRSKSIKRIKRVNCNTDYMTLHLESTQWERVDGKNIPGWVDITDFCDFISPLSLSFSLD